MAAPVKERRIALVGDASKASIEATVYDLDAMMQVQCGLSVLMHHRGRVR